jgi:rhodanese-related sulfurtransferase
MKKAFLLLVSVLLFTGFVFANGGSDAAAATSAAPAAPMADPVEKAALAYFAGLPGNNNIIPEADFITKVKAGEKMYVLDIRKAEDYAKGHIKGAVNMPWGPALAAGLKMVPQEGAVYVYCYTGQTAGQAIAIMRMAGIPATSVRYGFTRGISIVEGYQAVVNTDPVSASGSNTIDSAVQAAADKYFANLGTAPFVSNIVTAADANAIRVSGDDSVQFVDIRKAEDYAKGHIKGAINIPFAQGMQASFADLPADKKLIVNCYSGQTAGQAVAILKMLGYDAVSINSGMGTPATGGKGYISEGFEVVM